MFPEQKEAADSSDWNIRNFRWIVAKLLHFILITYSDLLAAYSEEGNVMNTDCKAFTLVLLWCHSISPGRSFLQKLLNQNRDTICFQQ